MSKINSISIGNCGEYFVAAELERHGFTVAVPMSNTQNFDILAINRNNNKQVAIQVKTNHTKNASWTLSEKNEFITDQNVYYVLVCLNDDEAPSYYILPSALVAHSIKTTHANYLAGKTKSGKTPNDTSIRKFSLENSKYNPFNLKSDDYKSNWSSIGKKYYELTKHLPSLDKESFGEWYTDKNADGSFERPFHLPCFSYSNEIEEFASAVRFFIECHPELGLDNCHEILQNNHIKIETIKDVDVSRCDDKCVCAMIVANVLAEKFCEGAILTSCTDKTFPKWLERLKQIDEA